MKYLCLAASPEVGTGERQLLRELLASEFGEPVREMALPSLDFAFDEDRKQHSSVAILQLLARICPSKARKLVAVTERDLFVPVLTFVFGQAQLGGRVAVISLARLRQEFYGLPASAEVFVERVRKETLHEAGHLFGLVHCPERGCVMSLATNVRQIDAKRREFCERCAASLRQARETA